MDNNTNSGGEDEYYDEEGIVMNDDDDEKSGNMKEIWNEGLKVKINSIINVVKQTPLYIISIYMNRLKIRIVQLKKST